MTTKVHDALTEALDCVKASGLVRKYSLVWSGRSEVPHITAWKATDASDEVLRHSLAESLAGLATESQLTIKGDWAGFGVASPEFSSALCDAG